MTALPEKVPPKGGIFCNIFRFPIVYIAKEVSACAPKTN